MKRYKNNNFRYSSKRSLQKRRKNFLIILLLGGIFLYLLFAWFLPTLIGGLSIFNKFKPVQKPQTPVSENATLAPPVLNIPYEATNSSSIDIKGYSLPNTKVEIYIDDELKSTTETNNDGSFVAASVDLGLGTNNISGKTIDEKGNKSLASKNIQIQYINEKPKLEINQPEDNQVVKDKKLQVSGTVEGSGSVSIHINGSLSIVGSDGKFSQTIDLNEGDNNITIIATDSAGNSTQISRKVTFQP